MIHPPPPIIPPSFASHAALSIRRVQRGISPVELVYTDHERWPFRPGQTSCTSRALHISLLDASFNPPTLAHLALANSLPQTSPQRFSATSASAEPYDARMLLLSVRNADKVLKPGDATFVQRLEMMRLLSHDMPSTTAESAGRSSQISGNIAVAVIDEPTFVGKSTVLLRFLQTRLATIAGCSDSPNNISDNRGASCLFPSPKLTFLMGFDTLVRLFSLKYYPSEQAMIQMLRRFLSPEQEACHIVCAYRQSASVDDTLEAAREFVTGDRIAFIDIGAAEQTYSSSEVRAQAAAGDERWRQLVTDVIANYILKHGIYSGLERE